MKNLEAKTDWVRSPSGLILPTKLAEEIYQRPKAIDLFCGAGGLSCGYISAGFEVIAGIDNDADAAITYISNLGNYPIKIHFIEDEDRERLERALKKCYSKKDKIISSVPVSGSGWISHQPHSTPGVSHFFFGDIRKITGEEILEKIGMEKGEVDCVMGGPPCQGFSIAGKRNVMDPRNSLVFDFVRMVIEIQPKTILFENVPGIISMVTPEGLPVIESMCLSLEQGGWGTYKSLLKALKYQTNSVGLLKGEKYSKKKPSKEKQLSLIKKRFADEDKQLELFKK